MVNINERTRTNKNVCNSTFRSTHFILKALLSDKALLFQKLMASVPQLEAIMADFVSKLFVS
jgi:hypothetical protein